MTTFKNYIYEEGLQTDLWEDCYIPLAIHRACSDPTISFLQFKTIVDENIGDINVSLHDEGTPIQILLQHSDCVTWEKFNYLITNGSRTDVYENLDIFDLICDSDYNSEYIRILDYVFENVNNDYTSRWFKADTREEEKRGLFKLIEKPEYFDVLFKHQDKFLELDEIIFRAFHEYFSKAPRYNKTKKASQ